MTLDDVLEVLRQVDPQDRLGSSERLLAMPKDIQVDLMARGGMMLCIQSHFDVTPDEVWAAVEVYNDNKDVLAQYLGYYDEEDLSSRSNGRDETSH